MDNRLILMLSVGTIFTFVWQLICRKQLLIKWYAALLVALLHTIVGVLSVKVFAFLESGFNPDSIGNMSLFGGIFFMPLAYWIGAKVTKRNVGQVFDVFTICMIFTVMCARINCIFAGCCFGILIPGEAGIRWPTRELEILFYVILLFILGRKIIAGKHSGEIYPIYMAAYGAFRFIVEFFRVSDSSLGIVHLSHVWAIVSFGIGISIYCEMQSRKNKGRR